MHHLVLYPVHPGLGTRLCTHVNDFRLPHRKFHRAGRGPASRPRRMASESTEEDVYERLVEKAPCAQFHFKLQECYSEHGDWRRCQGEMEEFRKCMAARAHHSGEQKT